MSETLWVVLLWGLLAALWWLFAFEYRRYRINLLRQRLFAVRDQLFQEAAAGKISFDSKAYGMTRTTLNGMIRFAHELSIIRLIVMRVVQRKADRDEIVERYRRARAQAHGELSPEQRALVLNAERQMHLYLLLHLIHTSFLLAMLVLPLQAILRMTKRFNRISTMASSVRRSIYQSQKAGDRLSAIDAEANGIGGRSTQLHHAH